MKITKISVVLLSFLLWMGVVEGSEKVIRFTHELPVTHHNHQAAMKLAEEIQKGSHGALTLKVFPAAQLFSDKESIKAIKGGAVEMGMIPINYWVAYTPFADIFELPFLLSDFKTAYRAEDGVLGSAIQGDADKTGIKILGWWDYGPTHFWGKTKPLKKPEDFKGLRIRVYGGMVANTVKAWEGLAPRWWRGLHGAAERNCGRFGDWAYRLSREEILRSINISCCCSSANLYRHGEQEFWEAC
jgi:TRAP-type C4-dicarboxylate transport system substrate-binding protein